MEKEYYWMILILIGASVFFVYCGFFQESNVEEKIETSSCEELKDGYINHTLCKNIFGKDICRGNLLFEYMDSCLSK